MHSLSLSYNNRSLYIIHNNRYSYRCFPKNPSHFGVPRGCNNFYPSFDNSIRNYHERTDLLAVLLTYFARNLTSVNVEYRPSAKCKLRTLASSPFPMRDKSWTILTAGIESMHKFGGCSDIFGEITYPSG